MLIFLVGGEDIRLRIPLADRLKEAGYEISIVGSEPSTPFDDAGIMYLKYNLFRGVNPLADLISIKKLKKYFIEYKPDIVHAFDTKPSIIAMIAAKQAEVALKVRTINGMGYLFSTDTLVVRCLRHVYYILQKIASSNSDITIFQNPDDRRYFIKRRLVKKECTMLVLGSGADFTQFSPNKINMHRSQKIKKILKLDHKPTVLMMSRLVRTKGVIEYLEAATRIKKNGISVRFLIAGPLGSEGKQACSIQEIKRYSKWVDYIGICKDVPELLANCDIFVLPTYYREGIPRVLLEAGSMGLPIITTDMPGCREVVEHGKNGWLVPSRNIDFLQKTLQNAIQLDKHVLQQMGAYSVKTLHSNFSLQNVTSSYIKIYQDIS